MDNLTSKTNELIKRAFKYWDISDKNIDNVDPVIKLLFAACANESIQLDKYIQESVYHTQEGLLNTFLPFSLTGPRPSSTILKALPVESKVKLSGKFTFEYEKLIRDNNKRENVIIPFKPAYFATLYKIIPRFTFCYDRLVAHPDNEILNIAGNETAQHSIWLGLDLEDGIKTLNELSVFIGLNSSDLYGTGISENDFFSQVKLFHGEQEIPLVRPIDPDEFYAFEETGFDKFSFGLINHTDLLFDVLLNYADFFFKVRENRDERIHLHKKRYPGFFESLFEQETLDQWKDDLVWLEFRFDSVHPDILQNVEIHLNAFPVINQKFTTLNLDKEEPVKRIKISDKEDLIGVTAYKTFDDYHNVIDTSNAKQLPFIIRDLKMEKFSKRDLFDLIDEMIKRFVSDKHAYMEELNINVDDMNKIREAMKPIMAAQLKVDKNIKKRNIYALYNTENGKEISGVELNCSITNGTYANGIPAEELFSCSSSLIDQDEIVSLTKTMNGQNRMSSDDKAIAVKQLMLSGNKIVTKNDIKDFCYSEFGKDLKSIQIKDGTIHNRNRLMRCIVVDIVLNGINIEEENLPFLKTGLENRIRRRSNLIIPVIVNLNMN